MNIKEAEEKSGIGRQNIRFYEKQGLLKPSRNRWNAYRDYGERDIRVLKLIRMMRMLDMPLEEIRKVLQGEVSPSEAARKQQLCLKNEAEKLDKAISLCGILQQQGKELEYLDVDGLLHEMEKDGQQSGFFTQWISDYRKIGKEMQEESFCFIPDEAVTDPRSFSDVLFQYARENNLDLVITKESMYPEFTVNGIEYTAYREHHVGRGIGLSFPVEEVICQMKYPEKYRSDVSEKRRWFIGFLNQWLLFIILLFLLFARSLFQRGNLWKNIGTGLGLFVVLLGVNLAWYALVHK